MQWRKIISLLPLRANTKLQLQIKKTPQRWKADKHTICLCANWDPTENSNESHVPKVYGMRGEDEQLCV